MGRMDEFDALIEESMAMPTTVMGGHVVAGRVMQDAAEELRWQGRREEGIRLAERAVEPARRLIEQAPGRGHRLLCLALCLAERLEEAWAAGESNLLVHPDGARDLGYMAALAARSGDRDGSSEFLQRLESSGAHPRSILWARALVAAQLGEHDEAVRLLRQAVANGLKHNAQFLHDFFLEDLRGYPPFEEFIKPKE